MNNYEIEEAAEARIERIATALETIAHKLPDYDVVTHKEALEELLREFVALMGNPKSTNEEWDELLNDVNEALG
jgi:hypothetical protein